MTPAHRTR